MLGECLLISSLPGNASRMLVDIARLAERKPHDSTCIINAEPGKLNIKRCEPVIIFINSPIVSLFKLAIMALFSILVLI